MENTVQRADETGVDETGVDEKGVDKPSINCSKVSLKDNTCIKTARKDRQSIRTYCSGNGSCVGSDIRIGSWSMSIDTRAVQLV